MILKFLKRSWLPYLSSLVVYSLVLSIILSYGGNAVMRDALFAYPAILITAAMMMLLFGMPAAFFVWRHQQENRIPYPHLKSGLLGFISGFLISLIFLGPLSIIPAMMYGGGYGFLFSLLFSVFGGLKFTDAEATKFREEEF